MGRQRSLFGEITFWHAIILTSAAAIFLMAFSLLLEKTAESFVTARLQADIARISTSIAAGPQVAATGAPQLGPLFNRAGGNKGFAVLDSQGRIVARGGVDLPLDTVHLASSPAHLRTIHGFYVLQARTGTGPTATTVIVAQNARAPDVLIDDVVIAFLAKAWWIIVIVFVAMLLASAWVTRRIAHRLQAKARRADAISPNDLDARIELAGIPTEVAPLVQAANDALDRLAAAYRNEAEFVGNVSHELRTPLATLAMLTEQIDDKGLRATMQRTIARGSHVIEQLLSLAGIGQSSLGFEWFDLRALASDVAADATGAIYRSGRTLELASLGDGPVMVFGHAGLVLTVLENLINNAVSHTAKGTHIVISIGPNAQVAVLDNGPGLEQSDLLIIGQRHWRAETRNDGGKGLGLAICSRIAALHQAHFEAYRRAPHGTGFVFRFGSPAD